MEFAGKKIAITGAGREFGRTLAVDRHASLDVSSNVAGHERYETTLGGKPTEAEAGSASLRVLGKHHLQAIRSYPNNLLIADIIVSGNSCSLTVDNRLKPGKRHPFPPRHKQAEEVYLVLSGSGRVKLEDTVRELSTHDIVRVAPHVTRGFEAGPDGMELLAFGARHAGDGEIVSDFWAP